MFIKHIFLLFFLLAGHFSMAQNAPAFDQKLKEIDRLIQHSKFEIVQKKIDSFKRSATNFDQQKLKPIWLELQYRQALILDKQEKSQIETLKLLLGMIVETEALHLYLLSCRVHLLIALCYERAENLELTKKYLDLTYRKIKDNKLEEIYSSYYIRTSSYYRQTGNLDSMFYYVKRAKEYSEKYHNEADLIDSYLLLSILSYNNNNYVELLKYDFMVLNYRKKINATTDISASYNNISSMYVRLKDFRKALVYSDSAYSIYKELPISHKYPTGKIRSLVFEGLGNIDSAYYYFKQYHNDWQLALKKEQKLQTKKLEEQYQNDKKEAVIKSKDQQLIFIIGMLVLITVATLLIIRKNRKINLQNKIINKQLGELSKTLEQKQILLSELQHRVKNNLQHVISILEIQKESVDFNNIDELIRGNQNRIHSMALLHKKLNISDIINEVDLKRYVSELSELVKDSYDNHRKKISLNIKCEVETISIEKALPLGLILTELISNSMKYAFKKQNIGIINIEITTNKKIKFYYADNGIGFDFNKVNEKGLGQEIIKGLIDQLDGTITTKNDKGFELSVEF